MGKCVFFLVILSLSCRGREETEEVKNAKWFFYAYATELDGYNSEGGELSPLNCNIKVNSIDRVTSDTTNFYFSLHEKEDTLKICQLKPLKLLGITAIRSRLYVPIYGRVVFDMETDTLILQNMNKQSLLLLAELDKNSTENAWLKNEAKHRRSK